MAKIRAAKPDVVFQFEPGGMGIAFMRAVRSRRAAREDPDGPVAEPSTDAVILKAVGDAAIGIRVHRALEQRLRQRGEQGVRRGLERRPTTGRSPSTQARATTRRWPIASALKATGGDVSNADAFREALRKADFKSVRGNFAFGPNQHPIQTGTCWMWSKGDDGAKLKTVGKIYEDRGDAYSQDCKM